MADLNDTTAGTPGDQTAGVPVVGTGAAAPARSRVGWKRLCAFVLIVVVAAIAGWSAGGALRQVAATRQGPGFDAFGKALAAAVVVVGVVGALLVHEVGHLLGGRLVGFRALLLIVGPVRLERNATGWRWRLNRSLALAGGLAASVPTLAVEPSSLRVRTAVMVAGGPVASLVVGVLAVVIWRTLGSWSPGPAPALPGQLVSIGLLTLGACSAAIGLVTLIPGQTAGFQTDGARLLHLYRGGPNADRDAAVQAVIASSMGGTRPRDWPPALLERVRGVDDGSYFEVVGWQLAQMHAADSGQRDAARRWLDLVLSHLDRLPEVTRPAVRYDAARQLAIAGDVEAARALVALGGRSLGAPFLAPLAELAILVAEGDHDTARQRLPVVRAMIADGIDPGGAAWLRDDVAALAAVLDAAEPSAPSR